MLKDLSIFIKSYRKRYIEFFLFLGIFGKIRLLSFLFYHREEWEDRVSYSSSTNIQIFTPNTP
jgi:hypothetical protein